jgi:integrase
LRLMLLVGARRNEVSRMTFEEIDEDARLWRIPAERSKNGRAHAVPLSPQAWAIIESMPRLANCPYVFTADGRSPIIGWAKAKTRLSAKAGIDEAGWALARFAALVRVRHAATRCPRRSHRASA